MAAGTAIFPLNTVLFPGGVLPLRIFETRYVDMVRECMSQQRPFGVCLIKDGAEVGTPANPEPVGCLAQITDWDMPQQGILSIRVVGLERFRIQSLQTQRDGLLRADIEAIPDDPPTSIQAEHERCLRLLKRVVTELEASRSAEPTQAFLPIEPPHRFDDAAWVSNRLAEIVPMNLRERHRLMAMDDPTQRLSAIDAFLTANQVFR